jgi:hypothetical protein
MGDAYRALLLDSFGTGEGQTIAEEDKAAHLGFLAKFPATHAELLKVDDILKSMKVAKASPEKKEEGRGAEKKDPKSPPSEPDGAEEWSAKDIARVIKSGGRDLKRLLKRLEAVCGEPRSVGDHETYKSPATGELITWAPSAIEKPGLRGKLAGQMAEALNGDR